MKKFILCAAVLGLFACNSSTENGYTVNVALKGDPKDLASDTLILLNREKGEDLISDTVVLKDGKATFKGILDTPQYFSLKIKGERGILARMFLENASFDINISLEQTKPAVSIKGGGSAQQFIDSLQQITSELYAATGIDSLMKIYPTASEQTKDSIMKIYEDVTGKISAIQTAYMQSHPTSFYTLEQIAQNVDAMNLDSVKNKLAVFHALPEYRNNKTLQKALATVNNLENLQPGKTAPDFVQNDPKGNPVKFSDVYKKYKVTMVDFWASWCSHCRRFNPTLVKIYNDYKSKGFGILGVSLDTDKEAWIKAIEDDGLAWEHVSDLGGWDNAVGRQYMVRFIPQNIFVDQDGKIIKRQASEEEIVEILNENLK